MQQQRRDNILSILQDRGFLHVEEAVSELNSSPATIRRDFNDLAEQGLVKRVRGGIKLDTSRSKTDMLPFALREARHSAEKEAIARRAAKLLRPGDVVIIDGGTTTFHLGQCLPDCPLRIITNSLRLAAVLDDQRQDRVNWEVFTTGGQLYPNSGLSLGPGAQASLSQYHADWAFLSVGGITEEGIFNTNELVVETERVMIQHATKVAILADHSKFGRHAMCHVCALDQIDYLVTDEWPANQLLLEWCSHAGVKILPVGR